MAILPEYLVQTCGVSHHCAKAIVDHLKSMRRENDTVLVDSILAGLRALHDGAVPSNGATNLSSSWAYAMGFAIRDHKKLKFKR